MTKVLQAVKEVLFTLETLVEGELEKNFLQGLYDMELLRFVTCDKIDAQPEEDKLEGLGHLAFEEIEGERGIRENSLTEGTHLLLVKPRKQNVGMEDKPEIALVGDYWDEKTTK